MPTLSVILIARNESRNIAECVRAAAFADEVIVLDSGSTDDTVDLARAAGAKVSVAADWQGFGVQKNRALALATGDWVLSIDADERITPQLRQRIEQAIASPAGHLAFAVNRRSSFCGQYMHHSGWSPDWVVRLFRREAGRFSNDLVHERVMVDGPVGRLAGELLHESMRDLESSLDKLDRYSTAGARDLQRRGKRGSLAKALGHGLWAFFRTYVLRRGFLDGSLGFVLAVSVAEGTYYRYLKLWLLQRSPPVPPPR
ncbi:glycosyltransferase family 2 protein [Ramlibacter sp. Leaf400]|uniref:glycosyltransferase family 2 protein n=1 Tax=Ramlibacter sp. Leaf400 TaxID=1736365 RepID=UPI0009E6AE41|nr:glycosyltransferase family 2 protein [Ramlibacter sp. Leaf400]